MDQRRAHSLCSTSEFFTNTVLTSREQSDPVNQLASVSLPIQMPASLCSKDRAAFVGLGWPKMAFRIPPSTSSDEQLLLSSLLLNLAMQLDTNPSTDRLLTTSEVIRSPTIIIGSGSHACRTARRSLEVNSP